MTISSNLASDSNPVVRFINEQFQWLSPDGVVIPGDSEALAEAMRNMPVTLAIAGEQVALHKLPYSGKEKKHFQSMAPFSLEDVLADDVDDLHFAFGSAEEGEMPLALIEQDRVAVLLADLEQAGLIVSQLVAEPLLLPWQADQWTVLVEADRVIVRLGEYQGFAIHKELLATTLEMASREALARDSLPSTVVAYYQNDKSILALNLPKGVRVDQRQADFESLVLSPSLSPSEKGINLLQGRFGPRLPWMQWANFWKPAAATAVVALLVHLGVGYAAINTLENQNAQLSQQTEEAFRVVVPVGRMVDPVLQLERKVSGLSSTGFSRFVQLFAPVAEVVASASGTQIKSITYSEQPEELRPTLLAPDFAEVEAIRARLEQRELIAEMTGSSNDAAGTRARLKIQGGGL